MRKKIVAGNWKMNKNRSEAHNLLNDLSKVSGEIGANTEVIVFPTFPFLNDSVELLQGKIATGAQNVSEHSEGAYTGEVSADMIKSTGATYCLVGHSERRQYFGENHPQLKHKIEQALQSGLKVIYCCGESLEERESGLFKKVVKQQIEEVLFGFTEEEMKSIYVAYEPVWAIGTGITATSEQAQEVHAFIRSIIADEFGKSVADQLHILYGGSCKPENATELMKEPDIDGGLIGGASLKAEDFMRIVNA